MSSRRPLEDEGAAPTGPGEEAAAAEVPSPDTEGASGLEALPESPEALAEQLETLRQERDELRDEVLRRRADFENYRRRVERDRHAAAQDALAPVFRELVATLDNLDRALSSEGGPEELREGVELTHRELLGLLESHDIVALDPRGETFDPTLHQALVHEPVPGFAEGTVAEVFRKGYSYGERLLRPALVKVAKGEESPGGNGDASEAD